MGYGDFKIHSDGVIERSVEKLESTILNVIEIWSERNEPLAALKAQRKCYKIAKKERKYDYKEYVWRLQKDHYPNEYKRSELGRHYACLQYLCSFLLFLGIICTIVVFVMIYQDGWDYLQDYFHVFRPYVLGALLSFFIFGICVVRKNKLKNKIQAINGSMTEKSNEQKSN